MTGQSDWLPMTIPTSGLSSAIFAQPLRCLDLKERHYRGKAEARQADPGGARDGAAPPPFVNDPLTNSPLVFLAPNAVWA
jgi:hypothetical protein